GRRRLGRGRGGLALAHDPVRNLALLTAAVQRAVVLRPGSGQLIDLLTLETRGTGLVATLDDQDFPTIPRPVVLERVEDDCLALVRQTPVEVQLGRRVVLVAL